MLTIACPKCSGSMELDENANGWNRCRSCGTKLKRAEYVPAPLIEKPKPVKEKTCKKCGIGLRKAASHCHVCGARARWRVPARLALVAVILVVAVAGIAVVMSMQHAANSLAEAAKLREQLAAAQTAKDEGYVAMELLRNQLSTARSEQSAALARHEIEVRGLASEIGDLKGQLAVAVANAKRTPLGPDELAASCTRIIEAGDSTSEQIAKAFYLRGLVRSWSSQCDEAAADWTRVIEMKNAPLEQIVLALMSRAAVRSTEKGIEDFTRVIEMKGVPAAMVAEALVKRGIAYGSGDSQSHEANAVADFTQVIEMKDAPAASVAAGLSMRARVYSQRGSVASAIGDYSQLIEMKDAPAGLKKEAEENRTKLARNRAGFDSPKTVERAVTLDAKIEPFLLSKERRDVVSH